MSTAFIQWNKGSRLGEAGIESIDGEVRYLDNAYITLVADVLSTEDLEGNEITAEDIRAGKKFVLNSTLAVAPKRYTRVLVDVNPELLRNADVRVPRIIEAGDSGQLTAGITALRKFDPSELEYAFRLYLLRM